MHASKDLMWWVEEEIFWVGNGSEHGLTHVDFVSFFSGGCCIYAYSDAPITFGFKFHLNAFYWTCVRAVQPLDVSSIYTCHLYAHPFPKIKDLYVCICFLINCGASVKHLFNGNGNLHVAFSSKMNSHFSGHVLFLFRLSEPIGTGAILKPGGMAAANWKPKFGFGNWVTPKLLMLCDQVWLS
jgi:hypothetical protein